MLQGVGTAAMLHTLRGRPGDWLSAEDAWAMGTANGAHALGQAQTLGQIAPGYRADLVCYRLDGISFTPLNDPVHHLVYAERGQSIDTVLVDGKVVVRGGRVVTVDETAILSAAREVHARRLPEIERCEAMAERMRPVYERIYERCLGLAIPADTFPARL
jgi:guanine deaminase